MEEVEKAEKEEDEDVEVGVVVEAYKKHLQWLWDCTYGCLWRWWSWCWS